MIKEHLYKEIIRKVPILCIDLVLKNHLKQFLLVKRNNEPLAGKWWVSGGRVFIEETVQEAVYRIAYEEVGLHLKNISFIGYYDNTFNENVFEDKVKYKTVSLVFESKIDKMDIVIIDDQSSAYKWSKTLPSSFIINT